MTARIFLSLLVIFGSSIVIQANAYSLQLVKKYDGSFAIREEVPAGSRTPTLDPGIVPTYNLKETPAKLINTSGNTVNIKPGNICAVAELGQGSKTSKVIVCRFGETFHNVTKMADSTTMPAHAEYKNYIGRGEEFPNKKLIYCDGPCKHT